MQLKKHIPIGLAPEVELMLVAAGTLADGEKARRFGKLISAGIDWDWLIDLSVQNRNTSMIHRELARLSPVEVPPDAQARLKTSFQNTTLTNLGLVGELTSILKLLEREGIAAVPYKGPTLAAELFDHPGVRHYWDLDLMVHKDDVLRVKDLLLERGFSPEEKMTPAEEAKFLQTDCEYNFDRDSDGLHVEIHWQVLPQTQSHGYDSDYLWDRLVESSLGGVTTWTLPPEEMLLILVIHGGDKHGWARLKWLTDIAHLIARRPEIDWARLGREAERVNRTRTLDQALYLARVLLAAPVPNSVFAPLAALPMLCAYAALVRSRIAREDFGLPGFGDWLAYVRHDDRITQGRPVGTPIGAHAFRYLRAVMRPGWEDQAAFALPSWARGLHYFHRPLRLFTRHHSALLGRLR